MKCKAVIFDLDGTLLDTIDDLADSANQILGEAGFSLFDRDKYFYFVGNGARTLIERILPEGKRDDRQVEAFLDRFSTVYGARQFDKTKPYAGIEEMLLKLGELRLPIAILSNKPEKFVRQIAGHYFKEGLFAVIAGQKDDVPHKPAPDGALAIAGQLNLSPETCFFVGDTSVDMETAKNAGMTAVGVSWGFRTVDELRKHGADYIIDSPDQLFALLN